MDQRIVWRGAATDPSGYGEATRNYVLGLAKAYPNIKLQNETFFSGAPCTDHWVELNRLSGRDFTVDEPYTYVQHLTPENYRLGPGKCRRHVGVTTFETDRLPEPWRIPLRAMDEVWTHSAWGRDVFEECGIKNVVVVPHGVDCDRFRPNGSTLSRLHLSGLGGDGAFTFGSNFDWSERKNPRALLTAYWREFRRSDDVALVIKSYHQFPVAKSRAFIQNYVRTLRAELGIHELDSPPIYLVSDMLDGDALAQFYRSLHAYVLPSRGEGWGLTYTEAMASALPTIGPDWGGNTEFMNKDNSLLLKTKLVPIHPSQVKNQPQYAGHRWADVDVDELRSHMRTLYDSKETCKRLGDEARRTMVRDFTWDLANDFASHRLTL
jgi:glycosyltransferase involved in cell wall biosynthesis